MLRWDLQLHQDVVSVSDAKVRFTVTSRHRKCVRKHITLIVNKRKVNRFDENNFKEQINLVIRNSEIYDMWYYFSSSRTLI